MSFCLQQQRCDVATSNDRQRHDHAMSTPILTRIKSNTSSADLTFLCLLFFCLLLTCLLPTSATLQAASPVIPRETCQLITGGFGGRASIIQDWRTPRNWYVTCQQGLYLWRGTLRSSNFLILTSQMPGLTVPRTFVQHPTSGLLYFITNDNTIYSYDPHFQNGSPIHSPSNKTLARVEFDTNLCPQVSIFDALIVLPNSFDLLYIPCQPNAGFPSNGGVVALNLTSRATYSVFFLPQSANSTTLRIAYDATTHELLVMADEVGTWAVNTTAALAASPPFSSVPMVQLLTSHQCGLPYAAVIDRSTDTLVISCFLIDSAIVYWNLSTAAVDGSLAGTGTSIYGGDQQSCSYPNLAYDPSTGTLFLTCLFGQLPLIMIQHLGENATVTAPINIDLCSAAAGISLDRSLIGGFWVQCAEACYFTEGRSLTTIIDGTFCGGAGTAVFNPITASTYVFCSSYSSPALIQFTNQQMTVIIQRSDCEISSSNLWMEDDFTSVYLKCSNMNDSTDYVLKIHLTVMNTSANATSPYAVTRVFSSHSYGTDYFYFNQQFYQQRENVDYLNLFQLNDTTGGFDMIMFKLNNTALVSMTIVQATWIVWIDKWTSNVYQVALDNTETSDPILLYPNCTTWLAPQADDIRGYAYTVCGDNGDILVQINCANATVRQLPIDSSYAPATIIRVDVGGNLVFICAGAGALFDTSRIAIYRIDSGIMEATLSPAKHVVPLISDLTIDTYSGQVLITTTPLFSDFDYSRTSVLTSGFRCLPGSAWGRSGKCEVCLPGSVRGVVAVDEASRSIPKCIQCEDGYIAQTSGMSSCLPCTVGRFADTSLGQICGLCIAGSYTNQSASTLCTQCERGRYANESESTVCYDCAPGRFSSGEGNQVCEWCNIGTYQPAWGTTSCHPCAKGNYSSLVGSTECDPCPAGSYTLLEQQSSCLQCPRGRYSNESGIAYDCNECAPGTSSTAGSTSCTSCNLGQFSSDGSFCITCSINTYSPYIGAPCISCTDSDQHGLECTNGLARVNPGWWGYEKWSEDHQQYVFRTTQCPTGYCEGSGLQIIPNMLENGTVISYTKPVLCEYPRLDLPDNWLCAECAEGYIAWGSSCQPCPGIDVGLVTLAIILSFLIVGFLLRSNTSEGHLNILVFFVQIAALQIGPISHWIDWIQFANLSARSTRSCLAPLSPIQQTIFTLCIPFFLLMVLGIICITHWFLAKYVKNPTAVVISASPSSSSSFSSVRSRPTFASRFLYWLASDFNRDRYIGCCSAILIFCYTSVTVTVVQSLHCVQIAPGISRLFNVPTVECHSHNYRWVLMPCTYIWLVVYVIGLPVAMFLFLWRRWHTVASHIHAAMEHQQQGNAAGSGEKIHDKDDATMMLRLNSQHLHRHHALLNSAPSSASLNDASVRFLPPTDSMMSSSPSSLHGATAGGFVLSDTFLSPSQIAFNHRWGHFYRQYRLSAWYWQPIEMLRRFAFALTSVLLVESPVSRYVMYGFIGFVTLLFHLWSHPFRSDRLNHVDTLSYLLLICVSYLLTCMQAPYELGIQVLLFLLVVPYALILFIWITQITWRKFSKRVKNLMIVRKESNATFAVPNHALKVDGEDGDEERVADKSEENKQQPQQDTLHDPSIHFEIHEQSHDL